MYISTLHYIKKRKILYYNIIKIDVWEKLQKKIKLTENSGESVSFGGVGMFHIPNRNL